MKRIRIAFVASTFTVGGAERVTCALASRLPRERYDVAWYFLRDAGVLGRGLLEAGDSGVENLQANRFDPGVLVRLSHHFRRWRPDIVFCMDHHNAMLWGRLAALTARVPAQVAASHSTGLFGRSGSLKASDRWLMEFTDRVVALSDTHARYLRDVEGVAPGRIVVIENGIDVDAFAAPEGDCEGLRGELGIDGDTPVVMMVAALRPEKAHEALLDAAERLVASGRSAIFVIVGDGPRRGELERDAEGRGLGDVFRFTGVRHDVARLLHVATVVVLPSHPVVETLPLAVLEAMAAGVPVVASRVGSIPELIDDGVTGRLIAPAHGGELAEAIAGILDDPGGARGMTEAARARVRERYSLDRMARGYQALFEELSVQE